MAKSIAIRIIYHNSQDNYNYMTISKIFKGLAQSGVWCFLDNIDRI